MFNVKVTHIMLSNIHIALKKYLCACTSSCACGTSTCQLATVKYQEKYITNLYTYILQIKQFEL